MAAYRTVLVEDHDMFRELVGQLLADKMQIEIAGDCANVADGTAAILRERPDLAIVDWMLPDGRGFDIVRAVLPKIPRQKWLFVSSSEQGHLVREAVSLGVQGFVMKRTSVSTLRQAVIDVLQGRKYYCPVSARLLVETMVEGNPLKPKLSARESEVLRRYARGESLKSIADNLSVSVKTVQNLISIIKDKLELREPAELIVFAIKHGFVESP